MQLYRISHCKHIDDMSGAGGLYASGRWHAKGTRILYFSEHISLAKLEVLVNASFLPRKMCLLTIDLGTKIKIEVVDIEQLPKGWNEYPYIDDLKQITNSWLDRKESAILKVPSSQSDFEFNYLINPLHKDVVKIKVVDKKNIKFDNRLKL